MAYNNHNYYPYQDPRAQHPYAQQQYHQQSPGQAYSPQRIEVQVPRIPQYDGSASFVPSQAYADIQYHQPYPPRQQNYQNASGSPKHPPSPSSVKLPNGTTAAPSKPAPVRSVETQARVAEPKQEEPEIDYALLLIDLAEDYFDNAFGKPSVNSSSRKELDYDEFCKLVATGLGCLQVVLKEWRSALQPSVEAAVRLRYATVLFQETENYMEAEEALSKGITHCERYKLHDLKYNMQHLLARISYATNPRAAVKFLDAAIKNAEAEQHASWLYALRFLRVSFSLDMNQSQETLAAFNQLKLVANLASNYGDVAVVAAACAVEALTHVRRSNTSEGIEQAQRAIASVRGAQMSSSAARIPNLTIMAHFVDLLCSLFTDEVDFAMNKMKAMQASLEELMEHSSWSTGGMFKVPISQPGMRARGSTTGIVLTDKAGQSYLQIKWLSKDEIYTLGYMLSAAVTMARNPQDRLAEKYLREATVQLGATGSTSSTDPGQGWRQPLRRQTQISLVFALCGRSAWGEAKKELNALKEMQSTTENGPDTVTEAFILYLEGMICQGTGDTAGALSIYSNRLLAVKPDQQVRQSTITYDLSVLAALNSILIVHAPSHPQHSQLPSILSSLEDLDKTAQSRNIRAAHFLVLSLDADTKNELLKTKENLQKVLQESKITFNNQLMCIALNFMTEKFFRGLVGDQSLKSARTALSMARKQKNDLWTSVANGLLAESLETQSMRQDAENVRAEARQIAGRLPGVMQVEENVKEGGWRGTARMV